MAYLTGFHCGRCDADHAHDAVTYTCPHCGGNLDATYDYAAITRATDPRAIAADADRSVWHYAPLLPAAPPEPGAATPFTTFGWSPLYRAALIERELALRAVWLKDDGQLPSKSFKDRASAMVVAHALATGVSTLCVASTGNAASALALMCAGTALRAVILVPKGTPEGKLAQSLIHGATVFMVDGSYNDAVDMARLACERFGWYNRSTGVNPYTREGKKTAAFEICEQLGSGSPTAFRAPDAVIVPVGDGNIISGVHKGFRDLRAVGWIDRMPRFIGATAALAPSLYHAWAAGKDTFDTIPSTTIATGISVDAPCDGAMALRAIRDTGGCLIECDDGEMLESMAALARASAVFVEPAAAAAHVALVKAARQGLVRPQDEVVLQLTGSGLKDARSALRAAGAPVQVRSLADIERALRP